MTRKIALKRLTKSDLTLFRWHFEHENAGNQKAINLNRDVFVDQLYPTLPGEADTRSGRFPLDLYIYGPGLTPELNLQRKIIKWGEYKNWRLNGEFIENPIDDPQRFNVLKEGDFALFEFGGLHYPDSARMCLVDQTGQPTLHVECAALLGNRRMMALDGASLDGLLARSGVAEVFPVSGALVDTYLEDAAQGGIESIRRLSRRAAARPITKEELEAALTRASQIGNLGEEFVSQHLTLQQAQGAIQSFEWTSSQNAVAPHDFIVTEAVGQTRVDVKATTGPFSNRLHVSLNELAAMADATAPYRIYRVYEIAGPAAKLRISEPLATFAGSVFSKLQELPAGVVMDNVSIDPAVLKFGSEIVLQLSTQDE